MSSRIDSISFSNYGVIPDCKYTSLSNINLLIGDNGVGKTFFLKALYSAVRSLEEYKRGQDNRTMSDILSQKLRWTFQVYKLGDLVSRGSSDRLEFELLSNGNRFAYGFSKDASEKIIDVSNGLENKPGNSVYIPAKEILSLFSVLLKSRDVDHAFGFDDTYYDLARALRIQPTRGKNYTAFSDARKNLGVIIDGRVEYDELAGVWYYKNKKNQKFSIGTTAEGVKKIAIMDRLFANGYLNGDSLVFMDEIDSGVHPTAICDFLDMIYNVSQKMSMQFFIASHSYIVLKKLALIAMKNPGVVKCISFKKGQVPIICDLYDGLPDNSIIDVSIDLYKREIDEVLS